MNILLGCHGQFGDLAINLPLIWRLKEEFSSDNFFMPIHSSFAGAMPLFLDSPITATIGTNLYETDVQSENFKNLMRENNIEKAFSPMPNHREQDWWKRRHQTEELAFNYGFDIEGFDPQIRLKKWWGSGQELKECVAFHPFPGNYSPGNSKSLSLKKCQMIVDALKKMGKTVIQLGEKSEPRLDGAEKPDLPFWESVRLLTDCSLFVGFDSGLTWFASGYEHPTLALYSNEYYGESFVRNIQPINQNAKYLDEKNVNEIPHEQIIEEIKKKI
jgi:ADP-heptose:LPS heptosyltransferase